MHPQPIHLKGLNGLRAIAALAVVLSHITMSLNAFGLNSFLLGTTIDGTPRGLDLAGFGVSIFFSLSGFLITYLLLLEKEKQKINVKHFYIRRILRIWPLYYLYLAISLTIILYFGFEFNLSSIFLYVFFSANIPFVFGGALPFLYHFWSLGVEEQFYLFWPWIAKISEKKILITTLILITILLILKLSFRYLSINGDGSLIYNFIHLTRFHCMLIGAMGAILFHNQHSLFLVIMTSKIAQSIAWSIMALVLLNRFHIASVIDNEIISIVGLILIIGQITAKNRVINLENALFNFLGRISYGLYITHPLIIFGYIKLLGTQSIFFPLKYVIVYGGITGTTILLSYLLFEYYEKWFLDFKSKYSALRPSSKIVQQETISYAKEIYVGVNKVPA